MTTSAQCDSIHAVRQYPMQYDSIPCSMTGISAAVPAGMQHSGQVLSVLVSLKDTAESFTRELQQNLAGVDAAELQQIAAAVYVPFESQVSR